MSYKTIVLYKNKNIINARDNINVYCFISHRYIT